MDGFGQQNFLSFEAAIPVPASWTQPQENFLIELMHDKVLENGANRVVGTFSKQEWTEFMKKFYERFGLKHDKKCFKNKANNLKERYKDFKKLRDNSTGLGWDPVSCKIDATREWWNEYLQSNPRAKRFMKHGCPEFDQLEIIFGGTVATGRLKASQNCDFNSSDDDDDDDDESDSVPSTQIPTTPATSDNEPKRNKQARSNAPSTSSRRKRRESRGFEMSESLKRLAETSEVRVELKKKNTIDECIAMLDSMGSTLDRTTYMRAIKFLQDKNWRATFLSLNESRKKDWLESITDGVI